LGSADELLVVLVEVPDAWFGDPTWVRPALGGTFLAKTPWKAELGIPVQGRKPVILTMTTAMGWTTALGIWAS